MKNIKLIINGGPGFNLNPKKNNLHKIDLVKIINEPDPFFHQAPSPGAPGSKINKTQCSIACECQDRRVWGGDAWMGRKGQGGF